jgi:hypothetical protein
VKKFALILFILFIAAITSIIIYQEDIVWKVAELSQDNTIYEMYESRWPEGKHADKVKTVTDKIDWEKARKENSRHSYEYYLNYRTDGHYAKDARDAIEDIIWQETLSIDTTERYKEYISKYPEGKHLKDAYSRIGDKEWEIIKSQNSLTALKKYIQENPEGKHLTEAKKQLNELNWLKVKRHPTIKDINLYIQAFPESEFLTEAQKTKQELLNDEKYYEMALKAGSYEALQKFLEDFPGHKRSKDAAIAMKFLQGTNITTLIQKGLIEVSVIGSGIRKVKATIQNKLNAPICVLVPPGTFFVSHNSNVQNMFTIYSERFIVPPGQTVTKDIYVTCANKSKNIPYSQDTFSIRATPPNSELAMLAKVLHKNIDNDAAQAAVWIITDNANYEELGTLRSGASFGPGFGGYRAISEKEVREALALLKKAGINYQNKAIWKDRAKIYNSSY